MSTKGLQIHSLLIVGLGPPFKAVTEIAESEYPAWILGLPLRQIVTDPANVDAPLEGMIAAGHGPNIYSINVCFAANPGQAGRIAQQTADIARPCGAGNVDAGHSARIRIAQVRARNIGSDLTGDGGSPVRVIRDIAIVIHTETDLGDQPR